MGFLALRVLRLSYVDLLGDGYLVKDFLENCPSLEELTLLDCVLSKLDLLCISCPKLKKLSILNLDNMDDGMSGGIKISCPKLVDLDLKGLIANNFFFECLDSLNKAELEPKFMGNIKYVLFPGISHVEHLLIDLNFFSQCVFAACDPALRNMKTLVLTTSIDAFTMDEFIRILKYYPKIESLKLIVREKSGSCMKAKQGDS
ncbi:uncharacterized protein LOC111882919 isoform X2 [Lactuca sativa]|uniref:uncharacterized protein LOC111882919 isoform X2 n=1 Tax=Lactuca sativa TaxID=4236 RepID=UPI001C690F57|nr:uncharacterized protein LOC111882919 isoform X2 [Lactuca sativa]